MWRAPHPLGTNPHTNDQAELSGITMFAIIAISSIAAVVAAFAVALWSDAAAFLREDTTAH
jgi:hypothetical protein